MYNYDPKPYTYKFTPRKLTLAEEARVRRHAAEAKRRAYESLKTERRPLSRISYEPKPYTYKFKPRKLTPAEEAIVRRRVAEARERAQGKLRERNRD